MSITRQQWNQLNDKQKNSFREEVGKEFKDGEYPSDNDIMIFLGNNGFNTDFVNLGKIETPPEVKSGDLWKRVLTYFNSNK